MAPNWITNGNDPGERGARRAGCAVWHAKLHELIKKITRYLGFLRNFQICEKNRIFLEREVAGRYGQNCPLHPPLPHGSTGSINTAQVTQSREFNDGGGPRDDQSAQAQAACQTFRKQSPHSNLQANAPQYHVSFMYRY